MYLTFSKQLCLHMTKTSIAYSKQVQNRKIPSIRNLRGMADEDLCWAVHINILKSYNKKAMTSIISFTNISIKEILQRQCYTHEETTQLICATYQMTGFYMSMTMT